MTSAAQPNPTAGKARAIPATTVVLVLLCLMYLLNYVVRVNVSTAAGVFKGELHLSNYQLGWIFSAFGISYLFFQIAGGWVSDRFGARLTLTLFALIWSAATILMGATHSYSAMLADRILLGLGVSALPTATRAMAAWMPAAKRGFAQGITHSAARLGNAITPPLVAWLIGLISWRGSFVVVGLASIVWALVWFLYYRDDPKDHPGITPEELQTLPRQAARIRGKGEEVPWKALAWRMVPVTIVYFCYGWTLWFFLAWIPQFFLQSYKLDLKKSAIFAAGVFFGGVIGDFLGGVVSDRILHRTGSRNKARRNLVVWGFLLSLVVMIPIFTFHNLTLAAVLLSFAFFFSEFTVGPMWAIPMDIAPRFSGFASGFMNTGSALAAVISPPVAGYIIDRTGNTQLPFIGSIVLLLLGAILAFWMKPDEEFSFPEALLPEPAVKAPAI